MIAVLQHQPGDSIQERYEVLNTLGAGAFGTVYKCRDQELDVLVAVKELHVLDDPDTGINEREMALVQFRREALHLSHLRHPHIVSGHYQPHSGDWSVCPVCGRTFRDETRCPQHNSPLEPLRQRHYLVMEYLDGPDLTEAALAAGGALSIPRALGYIRQIAEALQTIHNRGWVHRDIKPENIRLRERQDEAVLLDFGIATESGMPGEFTTRAIRHTTGGGTLGYAPDSPQERRHPDARSDIHALGMTLYRLVSGRDPQEPAQIDLMRLRRPRHFNANISPALEQLIMKAIHPDAKLRQQDAAEFLCELRAIIEPATAAAPSNAAAGALTASGPEPLVFRSGRRARDLVELARLLDLEPNEAKQLLYSGYLESWLESTGRGDLAQRAQQIRLKYATNRNQGLEAFAQATGLVESPHLEAKPSHLDFGTLAPGSRQTVWVRLTNPGRGHLFGMVRSSHGNLEMPRDFDGNESSIPITLDTTDLARGSYSGDITIDSSAGELRLPYSATVSGRPSVAPAVTVMCWALLGMLSGELLRTLPLMFEARGASWTWLATDAPLRWFPVSPLFGLTLAGVLCVLNIAESVRRRSCGFFFMAGLLTLLLSAGASLMGNELLIAGDNLLRPFMQDVSHRWAAGGWMFVGGIAGACYGTFVRLGDVFSTRLMQILLAWLISMAVMYGVLVLNITLGPRL